MNRHLLIFLDRTAFRPVFYSTVLLSKLLNSTKGRRLQELLELKHILVIRPGGLGDGLMSVSVLRALKKRYPETKITLMCVKKNKAALENLPYFDDIMVIDDIKKLSKNLSFLLKDKFDIVFDLEPFRKISSIIAYLSGAAVRVGFDTNNRRLLYTHHVTYSNDKCYESENMTRQLKVLDIDVPRDEAVDISFPISDGSMKKAKEVLESYKLYPQSDFLVAVAPGALKKYHRWIMSRFASLINMIIEEDRNVKVLLVGMRDDIPDAQKVMQNVTNKERIVDLVGKTSFAEALGVLRVCKILIACDGGVVYMGAAMGCGTISIWGPGVMERFKPPGDGNIGIRKDYFCVPCVNYHRLGEFPACPYDRQCIRDITVEDVYAQYVNLKARLLAKEKDAGHSFHSISIADIS